jgi:hypothetical protein
MKQNLEKTAASENLFVLKCRNISTGVQELHCERWRDGGVRRREGPPGEPGWDEGGRSSSSS